MTMFAAWSKSLPLPGLLQLGGSSLLYMQEADWLTTDRKYHLLKVSKLEDEISAVAAPCEANVAIPKRNCRLKTLSCIFFPQAQDFTS